MPSLDAAVALQFSGHLHNRCDLQAAETHLAACRQHFGTCHVFLHTWRESEPQTPHWSNRLRPAATLVANRCMENVRTLLSPVAVESEAQNVPPLDDATARTPDGRPFALVDHARGWGAARHFGWRNGTVHGMVRAAALRRQHEARDTTGGRGYAMALRLRPDITIGTNRPRNVSAASRIRLLWQCVAQLVSNQRRPTGTRGVGTQPWRGVNTCGTPSGYQDFHSRGADNCFFGTPRELDAVLDAFEHNYSRVYRLHRQSHARAESIPEFQIAAAARMVNVKATRAPCARPSFG